MLDPYLLAADTNSLSDRIDEKLIHSDTASMLADYINQSDTAAMLDPYLLAADTNSLSDRIDEKLNISDTASMLADYINSTDTAAMLDPYLLAADTNSLSNRIDEKLNISDTASMLADYINKSDTAAMLAPYLDNTDDQVIDEFALNADGKNLELSLEDDAEATKQVDLSDLVVEGDVTGTLASTTVEKIQGVNVSATTPTDGQVLAYNSSSSEWRPTTIFEPTLAEIYDASGGQQLDDVAFTAINFGTDGIVDTSDYNTSTTAIEVEEDGRYEITYRVSIDNDNNNRTGVEFRLMEDGVEVPGTRSYAYSRNNAIGSNTVTVTKILDLDANQEISVEGQVYQAQGSGTDTAETVANGSSLIIKRIK
jgi:hypothetical protein